MPRKRATKGTRSRTAREAKAKRQASRYTPVIPSGNIDASAPTHSLPPRELYHHEKARRADRQQADPNHPLVQARRMYEAMLAAAALSGKGGRPRKVVAPKDSDALDLSEG